MIRHRVDIDDDIPFKQKQRTPPSVIEDVRNHIEMLSAGGIIRQSKFQWASNAILARMKNGKLNCVDYRIPNKNTMKTYYALPGVEEVFD